VVVDLAPLRLLEASEVEGRMQEVARGLGLRLIGREERGVEDVPFDVLPVALPAGSKGQPPEPQLGAANAAGGDARSTSNGSSSGALFSGEALPHELSAAEALVEAQAQLVRGLKEAGRSNQDPEVQVGVQQLLKLKARLAGLQRPQEEAEASSSSSGEAGSTLAAGDAGDQSSDDDGGSSSSGGSGSGGSGGKKREVLPDGHPLAQVAIWAIAPSPLFFEGPRAVAKEFAKQVVAETAGKFAKR